LSRIIRTTPANVSTVDVHAFVPPPRFFLFVSSLLGVSLLPFFSFPPVVIPLIVVHPFTRHTFFGFLFDPKGNSFLLFIHYHPAYSPCLAHGTPFAAFVTPLLGPIFSGSLDTSYHGIAPSPHFSHTAGPPGPLDVMQPNEDANVHDQPVSSFPATTPSVYRSLKATLTLLHPSGGPAYRASCSTRGVRWRPDEILGVT